MKRAFGDLEEAQLVELARRFAPALRGGGIVHLSGELGAGKTTFARALLQALGVGERVKSPTYSLIESYRLGELDVHHLDLYRLADPGELEWLGLGDLWESGALVLIEWPERGAGELPAPDLLLRLEHAGMRRRLDVVAVSPRASEWLAAWQALSAGSGRLGASPEQ